MSLITTSGLSQSYGPDDIFSGLNLTIPPRARIALVGENGIGKTTLLNLLADVEAPSGGSIQRASQLKVGYLPQHSSLESSKTLWEETLSALADLIKMEEDLSTLEQALSQAEDPDSGRLISRYGTLQAEFERRGGYSYPSRVQEVLTGLGFDPSQHQMPVNHLSGGQRTRALLSQLLLSGSDLLILDEPTNHLDLQAIQWLEGYLKAYPGAVLLVSHDRFFIDQVCSQIWEMSRGGFEVYRGNYSAYLEQRLARWQRQEEVFLAEKTRLENELDYIKRNIEGQRTNQAKGKLKRLSRRIQAIEQIGLQAVQSQSWAQISQEVKTTTSSMSVQEAHQRIKALKNPVKQPRLAGIRFSAPKRAGDLVLRTSNLEIGYQDGDKALFAVPDITLVRGECAALIGPNGAGKTTFLKTILGQLPPLAGEARLGASLDLGYFAQAHQDLNDRNTVMEEIRQAGGFDSDQAIRSYLGGYLFSGDDVYKPVSILSGGERGRLALAKLSLTNANLLLLDEPTNHLDIPSQEALQAVLSSYEGTILLVSHDRFLISALATQIWEIDVEEENLILFEGSYQAYLGHPAPELDPGDDEDDSEIELLDHYQEAKAAKNRAQAADRRRAARVEELEEYIADLELKLDTLGKQLAQPPDDPGQVASLGHEFRESQLHLETLIQEWEILVNELDGNAP